MSAFRSIATGSSFASINSRNSFSVLSSSVCCAAGIRGYGITQSETKCPAKRPLTKPSACGPVNNSSSACCISFGRWTSASVMEKTIRRRTPAGSGIVANPTLLSNQPLVLGSLSATALTCAALGANTAGTSPDHFIASAMRADDVHEHVPERFLDAIGVAMAIASDLWFAVVRRVAGDHIKDFLFARARQVRDRTIERFLFHFRKFFQRQVRLSATRRGRFFVTFDELAGQPAKDVIGNAGRVANVRILGKAAWLESLIGELLRERLERHAVLKRNRRQSADGVHQPTDGAAFLRHGNEQFARLTVFVQANRDVTFMSRNLEPMRQRHARILDSMTERYDGPSAHHCRVVFLVRD